MRRTLLTAVLVASLAIFFPPLLRAQAEAPQDDVSAEVLRFTEIYGALEQNFSDPLDPDHAIFDGGIRGLLSTLDPFSAFFDRDQFEMLEQQTRGEALGFGSILYVTPGKVLVLQTAQGSPSWRAGLGPGDEIVAVDGTRLDRLDFQSLIQLLQSSRSHAVTLGVIHPGRVVPQDVAMRPAEVALPTVDKAFLYSPGIAYLHLTGFEQKTPQEVAEALERLGGARLKSLLLDLRDNHGGMVDSAVAVAGLFLKPDLLVLTTRGRSLPEKAYRTAALPARYDFPLVVLVNGNTASAAELLVAALQEHDRAAVAGEPTYGKGVVQSVFTLSEKTGLALTTAQYFTPSGRSIQRPLPQTALAAIDPASEQGKFHTDDGRPVSGGGGIAPDVMVPPRPLDPWVTFLNRRGVFTTFASEYLTLHGKVDRSFQPDAAAMAELKDFLQKGSIRVPEEFWGPDQNYLKLRVRQELFNLQYGLAAGDEVETRGDPQVQKALDLLPHLPALLKPPAGKSVRADLGGIGQVARE